MVNSSGRMVNSRGRMVNSSGRMVSSSLRLTNILEIESPVVTFDIAYQS
jgi:hypothetical protein